MAGMVEAVGVEAAMEVKEEAVKEAAGAKEEAEATEAAVVAMGGGTAPAGIRLDARRVWWRSGWRFRGQRRW